MKNLLTEFRTLQKIKLQIHYFSFAITQLCFVIFFILLTTSAQTLVVDKKKFFTDEQLIEMTLVSDFKKLVGDKLRKDFATNYQPATITCLFPDSTLLTEHVEIRPHKL